MNPTNYKIGAGSLAIDGADIGGTTPEGIVINDEPNVHLHYSGKFGMTPVKATLIGRMLTLQITMAEVTAANMAKVFAGVLSADSKIKFGGLAGVALTGKSLVMTPFDGTPAWRFRNAVPTSNIEVAYQVENERVYQVTFTAMIDTAAPEDENLAYVS